MLIRILICAGFAFTAGLLPAMADAKILAGWSQISEGGATEARLVTDAPRCPSLSVDGKPRAMKRRAALPQSPGLQVCVAKIPAGSKDVSADGVALPVPKARPRHIVIVGDTGCRLKGALVQACNDPAAWPFQSVSDHAAAEHPDLIIHVGDYLYRETPCKPDDTRCSGSTTGDNWPTWTADFFGPGKALLGSAVLLAERGNHETCDRSGPGWTALLGRDRVTSRCQGRDKPVIVDLGGVRIGVMDENDTKDNEIYEEILPALRRDLATLIAGRADWIVTHHPFRGVAQKPAEDGGKVVPRGANQTLRAVITPAQETRISLLLSGHIHNFQIENYQAPLAPQMVVGEGGDNLDIKVPAELTGLVTGGQTITEGLSVPGFGYVVMDRQGDGKDWTITVKAADGTTMRQCSLTDRHLSCAG